MNTRSAPLDAAAPSDADDGARGSGPAGWLALVREDVACVFARDPAARNTLELITIYPGVHAIVSHRIGHALWRRGWRYPARALAFLARMFTQIDIHPGARIGHRFFIDHGCGVVIGETADIGDDVTLYHGVTLGGTTWNPGKRHPTLGSRVVVGAGAKILGPIVVGDDARLAANSVVIADVPAGSTVVGIPGRVVVPKSQRHPTRNGIDLDHHLIPDPVGKAMACLLDRVAVLERELARRAGGADAPADACDRCEDGPCLESDAPDPGRPPGGRP